MKGTMAAAKVKVSITLSRDLLERVDRAAHARAGETRSSVIERWLRQASGRQAHAILAAETVAYYGNLTEEERKDDAEWAAFASQSFDAVQADDPWPSKREAPRPARRRRSR
jgi:hypothetical protein